MHVKEKERKREKGRRIFNFKVRNIYIYLLACILFHEAYEVFEKNGAYRKRMCLIWKKLITHVIRTLYVL